MTTNQILTNYIEKGIDKLIHILQNDTVKKKIQIQILEPFLHYILMRLFPYCIILCVIVSIFLILLMSILVVLVWNKGAAS
jgi:hypothetical protein